MLRGEVAVALYHRQRPPASLPDTFRLGRALTRDSQRSPSSSSPCAKPLRSRSAPDA